MGNSPGRVLVVDDDQDLLDLLSLLLDMRGYEVMTASNGKEALAWLEKTTPDLILLDMKMPVMNGWEFAEQYRRRHELRAPIVVVTASADARRIADALGAADFVGKPFDIARLLEKVARFAGSER